MIRLVPSLLCVLPLLLLGCARGSDSPPNIVLLIADDLGWPFLGFMGDEVAATPNLDRLAEQGVVFTDAQVAASTCVPSLRNIISGLDPAQWDAKSAAIAARAAKRGGLPFRGESAHIRTLPRELARAGYRSWEGGKMWMGTYQQAGFTHGLATAVPPAPGCPSRANSCGENFGRHGIDELREFLDEVGPHPFFAWVAPMLPHGPFDAPDAYRERYSKLGLQRGQVLYYANVSWLDAIVGEILDELELRGLRENTLVVFLSDNGAQLGEGVMAPIWGRGKASRFELGFRTPLVFSWPGHVPEGVRRRDLASSTDLFPTILDYAGLPPVSDRPGISLRRAIETGESVARDAHVVRYSEVIRNRDGRRNRGHAVRTQAWRYVSFEDAAGAVVGEELFAITDDPHEREDVSAEHPDVVAQLRERAVAWEAALQAAPEAVPVAGRVVDASSAPLAAMQIELAGAGEPLRARTDEAGFFEFPSVPRGRYRIAGEGRASRLDWNRAGPPAEMVVPEAGLGLYLPLTARPPRAPVGTPR